MSVPLRPRTWSTNTHPEPAERKPIRLASPSSSSSAAAAPSPPDYAASTFEKAAATATTTTTTQTHVTTVSATSDAVAAPSFLQPRVAAVLGVSRPWHPVLFSLRLLSILPSIVLGFPLAIRFLLMLHAFATADGLVATAVPIKGGVGEERLLLTELMLAIIWVHTILPIEHRSRIWPCLERRRLIGVYSVAARDTSRFILRITSCLGGKSLLPLLCWQACKQRERDIYIYIY